METAANRGMPVRLEARIARDRARVREALRLRHRVFAQELGAAAGESSARIDEDRFDAHCQHLVVRDVVSDRVVGTYRILSPEAARRAGGYYAQSAFDLSQLEVLRDRMVEVGRACVHPDYRSRGVLLLLWSGLVRYLVDNGHDYVMGSASVSLADGGHAAASIYRAASAVHMSPEDLRTRPFARVPLEALNDQLEVEPPPLLKGYLDLGAWICGEPALDPGLHCADLPLLLPLARMRGRYARHFLARAA